MKHILTLLICVITLAGFSQAKLSFDHRTHRFPKTKEGVLLEHDYTFTNTGNQPLLIDGITVGCTCTKFTYPKKPILPGESGIIHITFDTNEKYSWQDRILKISSNAKNNPTNIRFKVMVVNEK